MEEQLISFETAKLAKEKGFSIAGTTMYENDEVLCDVPYKNWNNGTLCFSAPTQSLLQKWLREVHDIHIKLECFTDNTWDGILIYENAPYEWDDKTAPVEAENCKTYEEALEICLQKALKLI